MIPHPIWVWAGAAIVIPLATLAGVRMAGAPTGPAAAGKQARRWHDNRDDATPR
jgi:hypothetical protein